MKAIFASFVLSFVLTIPLFSQQKYERETRIEEREVPEKALEFIQSLSLFSKVKWYKETGLNSSSFEAKAKHKGKKYSIEFGTTGMLEDIEILTKQREIPTPTLKKIQQQLQKSLLKYRIEKIQIQYSGDPVSLKKKIISNENSQGLTTRYELIVSAKKNGKYQQFEYLFSNDGNFLQQSNIVLKNTDNLEY